MKKILIAAAGVFLASQMAFSADSTFSRDKSHAYLIEYDRPGLVDLDLQKNTCSEINLGKSFNEPIRGVALSNTGFILCATKHAIWVYDPATAKCIKVCDALKGAEMDDIAYNPASGDIYSTSRSKDYDNEEELYCWPKGGKKWEHIYNRYDNGVYHPVFAADGGLFYIAGGDLWSGMVQKESDAGEGQYATLAGFRCAPLAYQVTQNTSPVSTGLQTIAISQNTLYGGLARMGGSGWGSVIRFKRPAPLTVVDGDPQMPAPPGDTEWKQFQAIFASIEQIADQPPDTLCTSQDGLVTLYTNVDSRSDSKVFIVQGDGKPDTVVFPGLADLLK